jgi:hypothetical protein
MNADRRLYRTADGKLCEENDPAAAFLAYPEGEKLSDADAKALGAQAKAEESAKAQPVKEEQAQPEPEAREQAKPEAEKPATTKRAK